MNMDTDIKTLEPLPDHKLEVELTNGRRGMFDLRPHLHLPALAALRQPAYFNQVSVFYGAATWPGGEDIAPATLAAELQAPHPA